MNLFFFSIETNCWDIVKKDPYIKSLNTLLNRIVKSQKWNEIVKLIRIRTLQKSLKKVSRRIFTKQKCFCTFDRLTTEIRFI